MPIRFACPACRTPYTVPDPDAGKKTECPACGQRVQIPVPQRLKTLVADEAPVLAAPQSPGPILTPGPPVAAPPAPPPSPTPAPAPRPTPTASRPTMPPPPPPLAPLPVSSGPGPGQVTGTGLAVLAVSLAVVLVGVLVLVIVAAGRRSREDDAAAARRDPLKSERIAGAPGKRPPTTPEPGSARPRPTDDPPPTRMKGVGPGDPRLPVLPPVPQNATGKVLTGDQVFLRLVHSAVLLETRSAAGTGFVVSTEHRLLVTNRHVVGSARQVKVLFPTYDRDGKLVTDRSGYDPSARVGGEVVATDEGCDLALVRVEHVPPDSGPVVLAKEPARPGDTVYSVGGSGAADNLLWRLTKGTVRGRVPRTGRIESARIDCMILETDAPSNKGDSGGPVLNDRGELVAAVSHGNPRQQQVSGDIDLEEIRAFVQSHLDR